MYSGKFINLIEEVREMSKYLMAIDAGTGSVRAVIFDLAGNQIAAHSKEWEHKEDPRYPGSMDFDWDNNWRLAAKCVKESMRKAKINEEDILAVSTTSMREGIVLYDVDGKEIWACANVDSRSNNEVKDLMDIDSGLEKDIYKISGQTFALGALPRVLWVKKNMPEIYKKTETITMFNDWLIYKLSGVLSTEPSNGCTTGIFDIKKRDWEPKIAERCGLKSHMFPEVYEPGTVVGKVNEQSSRETGLSQNTLVVSGGGDAQLGAIGVGLVGEDQVAVFGGSFWQLEYNTKKPVIDEDARIRVNCHAVEDMWNYEAIAFFPGLILRWYRDAFCDREKEVSKLTGTDPYDLMNERAKKIPAGSYGMMGAFSNVMDYISWRHAAPTFTNFQLDPEKYNKYTFYRSLLENAALVTKGHLEMVKELTGNSPEEVIFANGASKSELWSQIMADVLEVKIKVPVVKEATALGAAICAGVGAGVYESIEEAANSLVVWDKEYIPNEENVKTYRELYNKWKAMYEVQLAIADGGVTEHMWKAPGI